ncbi:hypothetical protein [Alteribacter natronophilus]|uniref:hypothetical protein n=1 Tax=Alteribacter natronophilus TaxID=2583810 RepID=UPI00110E50CE|nr:hypothetical protein [Alteribacter natronophilus]TMW72879.1 hypothetical protein FGB90_00775 [Alteribacter natronophilus]
MLSDVILTIMVAVPLYALFLWVFFDPEGAAFFGSRWMYREPPELSDPAIKFYKITAGALIVILTLVLIVAMINYEPQPGIGDIISDLDNGGVDP